MNAPARILLIQEDARDRGDILAALKRAAPDAQVLEAGSGLDYAQQLSEGAFEVAIAPVSMSWGEGVDALTKVRQYSPECMTILMGETPVSGGPHHVYSELAALVGAVRSELDGHRRPALAGPQMESSLIPRPMSNPLESAEFSHLAAELLEVEQRARVLMDDNVLGPYPRQVVAQFQRSAERLQFIIDHLGGKAPTLFEGPGEPIHLGNAVIEAMRGLQERIRDNDARVLAGSLPVLLVGSGNLTTLFHHLLDNSLKFRSKKPPRTTVRAHEAGSNWIISVSDNGRGMAETDGADPFQMFARLPGPEKLPGTGVGLAVCRQIARRYRGDIWYESESGQGTTVYVRLKVATATPVEVQMTVSFNGDPVGRISVSNTASKAQITKAALALPAVDTRLGEETIKDVQLMDHGVINIVS